MAEDAGILRLRTEGGAPRFAPGQFLQFRPWEGDDPLLARPFSILDQGSGWLSLLYQVLGRGTRRMQALRPGDSAVVVGPLGRPFPLPGRPGAALIVAGGVGIPPFLLLVRALVAQGRETVVLLGARDAAHLYLREELAAAGARVAVATEDGSAGRRGRVTLLLDEELAARGPETVGAVYTCGPEPMMEAVVARAKEARVPGWASMERHMACGYGVCFTCVLPLRSPEGGYRNRRTCLEGPVLAFQRLPPAPW